MATAIFDNSIGSSARPRSAQGTAARWTARVLTTLAVLFFAFDVGIKLSGAAAAVQGTAQLGFDPKLVIPIGVIELICFVLYLIPRTAPIGALLFTGYLGGAIATHLRLGNPLFTHILSPIYFATILWGSLYLRDARVRAFVGPRTDR